MDEAVIYWLDQSAAESIETFIYMKMIDYCPQTWCGAAQTQF